MSRQNRAEAPQTYVERLRAEMHSLHTDYESVLDASAVLNIDPNRGAGPGVAFIGFPGWGWVPSDDELEQARMSLLPRLRLWIVRFRLLFPNPTPTVAGRLDENAGLLERWLMRSDGDTSVPSSIDAARTQVGAVFHDLNRLLDLVPPDPDPVRLVVDTNALIDDPDLARYIPRLGPSYLVHLPPVVLTELDDLKRSGRTPELREQARRADRRLKGIRDNGDVRTGAVVAGRVRVVFEFRDPDPEGMPSWLDLSRPGNRLVASCLRLQSDHPGSALYVATSDLNLQTKLAAVGLPFIEMP